MWVSRLNAAPHPSPEGVERAFLMDRICPMLLLVFASCSTPQLRPNPLSPAASKVKPSPQVGPLRGEAKAKAIRPGGGVRPVELPSGEYQRIVEATITILESGLTLTAKALADRLANESDPSTTKAIVQALAEAPGRPPAIFVPVLLGRLNILTHAVFEQTAAALGRSLDATTFGKVKSVALSSRVPVDQRAIAVMALGYYRDKSSAAQLVQLSGTEQPDAIRHLAMDALARLTGNDTYGHESWSWQHWFDQHQHLRPQQWQQRLIEEIQSAAHQRATASQDELSRKLAQVRAQSESLSQQSVKVQQRLVEVQTKLYRAMAKAERPALLVTWLADDLVMTRLLAVDLASEPQVRDDETLRSGLRRRLADTVAQMRQQAALLLWRLNDEEASDWVASRLNENTERDKSVLKAYLLLMGGLPRAQAVQPVLAMLDDPVLAGEAAGALAAAIDRNLLSQEQLAEVLRRVRLRLAGSELPAPQFVPLLARVGNTQDWKRIADWLDAPDEKIKEAAALAWAQSDRSLWELVKRSGDEDMHIQQIVIAAAHRRGRDPTTMLALIDHKPADAQIVVEWRRALVSMASRVPIHAIETADQRLVVQKEASDLRENMLSAAINPRVDTKISLAEQNLLAKLLLRRAEIRLTSGQPQAALADMERLEKLPDAQICDVGQRELWFIRLRALLDQMNVEQAGQQAAEILDHTETKDADRNRMIIARHYLNTAERHVTAGQFVRAIKLIDGLRSLLGDKIPQPLIECFDELERQVSVRSTADDSAQDSGK